MFLIYVNDLSQVTTTSSVALYADDTKCYYAVKDAEDSKRLQRDLNMISQWCKVWQMDSNQSKCGLQSDKDCHFAI